MEEVWGQRYGDRLHLRHGPIDLQIRVDGFGRRQAYEAARIRFGSLLHGLVAELVHHRRQLKPSCPPPRDVTARRMYEAAGPFASKYWLTPMIAVAGSVADEVLATMTRVTKDIERAYVNNGGDIAMFLRPDQCFSAAIVSPSGHDLGRIHVRSGDGAKGIATSGQSGRSFSFGIADAVTVVAHSAASADVAATLIANEVDVPDHRGIERMPANTLFPDSDLNDFEVVTNVPRLSESDITAALVRGSKCAQKMLQDDLIDAAALFLQSQAIIIGTDSHFELSHQLEVDIA